MKKRVCTTKDYLVSNEKFEIVWSKYKGIAKTYPKPLKNNLKEYYNSENYISHNPKAIGLISLVYLAIRSLMNRNKLKMIKPFLSKNDKVLDFGSGSGSFLYKLNFKYESFGVEPNDFARSTSLAKGLRVVSAMKEYKVKFNMIFLWHSLEHVYDINKIINEFSQKINSKGILVIALPNIRSFDAKKYKSFWAGYDVPRHLWHFTEEGIIDFLEKKKFKFIKKRPLFWDAIYISYLSEKYRKSKFSLIKGAFWGIISNLTAIKTGEFSSKVYFFRKS
ncbi:MAG: class I SAM-dependent methyltransferase [Flavobacteriaceae bacterium]